MYHFNLPPQRIEEEVDDRRHRMDYLNQAAVLLMQQGSEEEVVRVQQELDEFKHFSRQVLDRVDSCRATLHRISAAQVCRLCGKTVYRDEESVGSALQVSIDDWTEKNLCNAGISL